MKRNINQIALSMIFFLCLLSLNSYVLPAEASEEETMQPSSIKEQVETLRITPPTNPPSPPSARWAVKGIPQKEAEKLHNTLQETAKQLQDLTSRHSALAQENTSLATKNEGLARQIRQLNQGLEQKESALKNTSEQLKQMEHQLANTKKSNDLCETTKTTLESTIRDQSEQLAQLNQDIRNIRANKTRLEQEKQQLENDVSENQKKLKDCKNKKKYAQQAAVKITAFIASKEQLYTLFSACAPRTAPHVFNVPIGSARQLSEFTGHALQHLLEEIDGSPDETELLEIACAGGKAFARELGLSIAGTLAHKIGLDQQVRKAYNKTVIPQFLERHNTIKQITEKGSVIAIALVRLAVDQKLEQCLWSQL